MDGWDVEGLWLLAERKDGVLPDRPTARGAGVRTPFCLVLQEWIAWALPLVGIILFRPTGGPQEMVLARQGIHATKFLTNRFQRR
jgi:hypothetical protein